MLGFTEMIENNIAIKSKNGLLPWCRESRRDLFDIKDVRDQGTDQGLLRVGGVYRHNIRRE